MIFCNIHIQMAFLPCVFGDVLLNVIDWKMPDYTIHNCMVFPQCVYGYVS